MTKEPFTMNTFFDLIKIASNTQIGTHKQIALVIVLIIKSGS